MDISSKKQGLNHIDLLHQTSFSFLSHLGNGVEGVILVDKPVGLTSHDVVNRIRRITGVKRVGHTGTLDPLASGLLIILIGRNHTKLQSLFLKQDKTYEFEVLLGHTSTSYDMGERLEKSSSWSEVKKIDKQQIQTTIENLIGIQDQQVPVFSAVKVAGKKLYNLARQGNVKKIYLPVKKIEIYNLLYIKNEVDEKNEKSYLKFRVFCSSGTYVRALTKEIGEKLEVGAVVTSLRRMEIGSISVHNAVLCPLK